MVIFTFLWFGQFCCVNRKLKQALGNYLFAYKNIEKNDDFYLNHIRYEIAFVKGIIGKHN